MAFHNIFPGSVPVSENFHIRLQGGAPTPGGWAGPARLGPAGNACLGKLLLGRGGLEIDGRSHGA